MQRLRLRRQQRVIEPAPGNRSREVLFDEALLARIRAMSLTPSHISNEGLAGEHRSRRRGSSPEFADFKAYSQGDDFRRIDWNIYSRLGSLFVRLSEVTTELPVHFLLDASASMGWTGSPQRPPKFTIARQLTGLLAYLGLQRFDRVTITPFADGFGPAFGPAQGRSSIQPMLSYVTSVRAGGTTSLPRVLDQYAQERRRPGFLLLVSDLMSGEPEELGQALRGFRARGWDVAILQPLDPAELDPELLAASVEERDAIDLLDLESGERLRLALTGEVVERCREAVAAWMAGIDAVCLREQIVRVQIDTSQPVSDLLRDLTSVGVIG
jgi:uncharacterized protein (DUF58 family)